jgi:hypothetical protein
VLIPNDLDKQQTLACELKVYFNSVMQEIYTSAASSTSLSTKRKETTPLGQLRKFEIGIKQNPLRNSIYALSTIRDQNFQRSSAPYA